MEPKNINFAGMPAMAISVVTKPAEFFRGMPKTGGFLEPLLFAVLMGFIAGIIQAVLGLTGLGYGGYGQGMMGGIGVIIILPVVIALFSFIFAAILYVIWKLMGSQENYETAYRCCAYLTALSPVTSILGFIPYVGILLNMAIFAFYFSTASIHVHNLPSQKAWLVFGIIAVVFALLGISAEYQGRRMMYSDHHWRMMGEDAAGDFRKSTRDMEKSADEMRRQAERMTQEYEQQRRLQQQDDD
jgi:hypothetical protein